MTIALISHPECALHEAGDSHPEQPARVKVIEAVLHEYPFHVPVRFYGAPLATKEELIRAHTQEYVDWIFSVAPHRSYVEIDPDTYMNPHTLNAALRAAGAVIYAVDLVMSGEVRAAFCNVRPPGHHAEHGNAMGFCFFNNVAVGARHAMLKYDLQRIVIVDFDVHHGNGTQNIFQNDKHVLYCSSFEHPFYPGYDSELDNEHLLPVPLPAGTDSEEYRALVQAAWFEKIAAFQPQLIFISAGFDAHRSDPLADINLTESDYVWLTTEIVALAKKYCDGRIVSVLEGGYNLDALKQCVPAHVNALE